LQAWALELRAGQEVTTDLVSSDFDSYLMVTGPGLESGLSDDDGGGGCDARITFTAPEDGEYRAIVGTADPRSTGQFVLSASVTPPAGTLGPCRRAVDAGDVLPDRPSVLAGRTDDVPTEGSSTLIVRAQLEGYSGQMAMDVVRRFNSRWLRTTRPGPIGPTSGPSFARVSIDGATPGDLGDLDAINADDIEYMRYLNASDATIKYGTGFTGGVIEVTSRGR
jgi:hypothetical protein